MFDFMIKFQVETITDYRGYYEDRDRVKELNDQFTDVAKHFKLAYSSYNRKIVNVLPGMKKRDNIVRFGTDQLLVLTWKCITTPEGWTEFCNGVNDYVKDKDYAKFTVYSCP